MQGSVGLGVYAWNVERSNLFLSSIHATEPLEVSQLYRKTARKCYSHWSNSFKNVVVCCIQHAVNADSFCYRNYNYNSKTKDSPQGVSIWFSVLFCVCLTAVVWSCLPFIWSGQNHLARHSERGKKTRRTKEEVGRQHQGMDRPGLQQVPEGSGEQGKMEKTGCKIICGAPTTLAAKGLMMMMMISMCGGVFL